MIAERAAKIRADTESLKDALPGSGGQRQSTEAKNASKPSPILELFRRRNELRAAAWRYVEEENPSEEEMNARLENEISRIDDALDAIPVVTAAEFAAKAIVAMGSGGVILDWEKDPFWIEARRLTGYDG